MLSACCARRAYYEGIHNFWLALSMTEMRDLRLSKAEFIAAGMPTSIS